MDKLLRDKKYIALFVLPGFLLFSAVMFIPIIQSIIISFYKWDGLGQKQFINFSNYLALFKDEIFAKSFSNTLILMGLSLVLEIIIGLLLAYIISKGIKGSNCFRILYFIPGVISAAVIGLLWTFIYNYDFGLVNIILRTFGLKWLTRVWLGDKNTVLYAITFVIVWQYVGYYVIIFLAAILGISDEIFESAKLDGANEFQLITKIVLPLIKPIIKVSAILICTGSLRYFDLIFVMTGGGPVRASEVFSTFLYQETFTNLKFGYGSAISTVLLILSFGITALLNGKIKNINN